MNLSKLNIEQLRKLSLFYTELCNPLEWKGHKTYNSSEIYNKTLKMSINIFIYNKIYIKQCLKSWLLNKIAATWCT